MFENLKKYLVEEFNVKSENITMESELQGDLGLNSLELAQLVLDYETEYNIEIDDEKVSEFKTVGDVVRYLENVK